MNDEKQDVVSEEIVTPPTESENQEPGYQEEIVPEAPKKGSSEYNFREMRGVIQRQQQEIDDLRTSIVSPVSAEPEEIFDDDDIPNIKQVRKLISKDSKANAEELLRQRDLADFENKLRQKYSDFDAVVSEINVKELIRGNERLHSQLLKMNKTTPAEANELAYELIKKSAFYNDNKKKDDKNKLIKQTAKENSSKPVASHAIGSSSTPLQQANSFKHMSQEEKYKIWQDMQTYAGRH